MNSEFLIELFEEPSIIEITLATNEYPLIIQNGQQQRVISVGKLKKKICEEFLMRLQQRFPGEEILPTQDKRLVIYTSNNFRLVVNALIEDHYTITIKKIQY